MAEDIEKLDAVMKAKPAVPGTIENLYDRPKLQNDNGSYSTTRSMSFEEDGMEVLVPTVIDGKSLTDEEAIEHYHQTGEHLGKFKSVEEANSYAQQLHENQAKKGEDMSDNVIDPTKSEQEKQQQPNEAIMKMAEFQKWLEEYLEKFKAYAAEWSAKHKDSPWVEDSDPTKKPQAPPRITTGTGMANDAAKELQSDKAYTEAVAKDLDRPSEKQEGQP